MPRILVIDARFYADLANELVKGALCELDSHDGVTYDRVSVPGVFEIAPAINFACSSGEYDGYVALGCVVRGQTTHYDYVCSENARALTDIAITKQTAIGYGVLTVENQNQAWVRAAVDNGNKGADAAVACLEMIKLKHKFCE